MGKRQAAGTVMLKGARSGAASAASPSLACQRRQRPCSFSGWSWHGSAAAVGGGCQRACRPPSPPVWEGRACRRALRARRRCGPTRWPRWPWPSASTWCRRKTWRSSSASSAQRGRRAAASRASARPSKSSSAAAAAGACPSRRPASSAAAAARPRFRRPGAPWARAWTGTAPAWWTRPSVRRRCSRPATPACRDGPSARSACRPSARGHGARARRLPRE
mmetsp:Transcript_16970/g.53488  ORF Transcript_16970/g.53488 Transcript_16970/m.53488 type:complete len:220 (+) Transcript_16970:990-1649(+)